MFVCSLLSQVVAETLLLESNDTGKAILDLISILNITNLVIGIKKLPHTRYAITTSQMDDKNKGGKFLFRLTLTSNASMQL